MHALSHRNRGIDLLRGVSILLVLLHHFGIAYPLFGTTLAAWVTPGAIRAVLRNGNYGVTIFFAVSGFLITRTSLGRWGSPGAVKPLRFYRLRAARILPCLLLLLAVDALLAASGVSLFANAPSVGLPLWRTDLAALTLTMNLFVIHHDWGNYALGALWSLSVEEAFYLAFPLLCLALRGRAAFSAALVAIAIACPFFRAAHQDDAETYLYHYFAAVDGIALGCLAALWAPELARPIARRLWLGWLVAAAMAALYLSASIGVTNIWGVSAMALGACVLLLGFAGSEAGTPLRGSGPLRWLGRHSYELYLFHLIVLGSLRSVWPGRIVAGDARVGLLVLYLGLATIAGWVVARFWSEPLNRTLRGVS